MILGLVHTMKNGGNLAKLGCSFFIAIIGLVQIHENEINHRAILPLTFLD
jgi:hypothetical protein